MFLRILLYVFLAYLLYKIVFGFIIPVYKTTRQVKKGFREMHKRMSEQMNAQQNYSTQAAPQPSSQNEKKEDYIDFEEIK
jgi:Sec-independent protein translocase protein TatA